MNRISRRNINVSGKVYSLLFLLVITIAALLRFPNLTHKGLYYHDEASFMSVGRFYAGMITYIISNGYKDTVSSASIKSKIIQLRKMGGSTLEEARPLFSAALVVAVAIFGDNDSVGLLFSAVFSILTIALFYSFGKVDSANPSYLIAGLLLSLSVWHVHYSRSALSQSFSLFFISWTVLVIIQEYAGRVQRPMNIRKIAFLSGLTFNTHYGLFWLPVLVACWLAYVEWQGITNIYSWLKTIAIAAFFMSLSSLVFEVWYEVLYFISLRFTPSDLHRRAVFTYFEQIHNQLVFPFGRPDAPYTLFLTFLCQIESVPFVIAMLLGFLYLAYGSVRSEVNALLFCWILVPLFIWAGFRYPAPRSYLPCLPPLMLGAGMFFDECFRHRFVGQNWNRLKDALIVCFLVVVGCLQFVKIVPLWDSVSPYKTASEGIRRFCTKNPDYKLHKRDLGVYASPLLRYYLGEIVVEEEPGERRLVITDYLDQNAPLPRMNGAQPVLVACYSTPLETGMILYDAYYWQMVEKYRHGDLLDAVCVYKSASS